MNLAPTILQTHRHKSDIWNYTIHPCLGKNYSTVHENKSAMMSLYLEQAKNHSCMQTQVFRPSVKMPDLIGMVGILFFFFLPVSWVKMHDLISNLQRAKYRCFQE